MHRLIVTSNSYRQSSQHREDAASLDLDSSERSIQESRLFQVPIAVQTCPATNTL
jgi:hypothetical protein